MLLNKSPIFTEFLVIRARDLTRYVNLGFGWPGSGGFKTKC